MKTVGIFDAKTHLSSLVDEVERGGEVVITRHGKPVAKLVPAAECLSPGAIKRREEALDRLSEIGDRLHLNLTHDEIKRRIEEGRR